MHGGLLACVIACSAFELSHTKFGEAETRHRLPPRPLASLATSPQRGEVNLGHDRAAAPPLPVGKRSAPKAPREGDRTSKLTHTRRLSHPSPNGISALR